MKYANLFMEQIIIKSARSLMEHITPESTNSFDSLGHLHLFKLQKMLPSLSTLDCESC